MGNENRELKWRKESELPLGVFIREEQAGDELAIHDLTLAAFEPMPFSKGSEAPIITGLREDGNLSISLVAVAGWQVIGHIAFSPITVGSIIDGWYGLGPVSVLPDWQRRGVGRALIAEGLAALKALGAKGCALVGDAQYYSGFGFRSDDNLTYEKIPTTYVQCLGFGNEVASGEVKFSRAFQRFQA